MTDEDKDLSEFEEEFDEESLEDPGSEPEVSDEDFLDEEDGLGDEDWEDDEFDSEELSAKPKKAINFNTIVIGVGLVIGLGMFLMQVTKSDNRKSAARIEDPPVKGIGMAGTRDSVVYQGIEKEEDKPVERKSGLLSDLDSVEKLPDYQPRRTVPAEVDDPPQPKPFSQQTQAPASLPEESAVPETSDMVQQDEGPLMPMPDMAETEDAGALPSLKAEAQMPGEVPGEQTIMAPVMSAEESTEISAVPVKRRQTAGTAMGEQSADLAKITSQLENISKRLETLESRLGSASVDKELADLKKTVSRLEGQIKDGGKAATSAKASKAAPASAGSTKTEASVKQAPVRRKALPVAAVKWELRAAQPGRAWVAKAGSEEMQMVDIGDNLAGVGTITSISYENGTWIIQGSQGKIAQ
jgi:intracellular multiplication protein IcmG